MSREYPSASLSRVIYQISGGKDYLYAMSKELGMATPGMLVKLRQLERMKLIIKKEGTERVVRYGIDKRAIARMWADFIAEMELDENLRRYAFLNEKAEAAEIREKAIRKKNANLKDDECFSEFTGMYLEALAEVKYSSSLVDAFEFFSTEVLPALFIERGREFWPSKRAADIQKKIPFAWYLETRRRVLVTRVVDVLQTKIMQAKMLPKSTMTSTMPLDYGKPKSE